MPETYPLSKAAVEAGARALWNSEHPNDPATEAESAFRFLRQAYEEEAMIVLRAAIAAWDPSVAQMEAARELERQDIMSDSILAAVRTEA